MFKRTTTSHSLCSCGTQKNLRCTCKRIISDQRIASNVGGDEIAEAILDYQRTGTMIRSAIAKLDGLSFENFIGDWCIEQGGYQVLDIREEK